MRTIGEAFAAGRASGSKLLIPYLTAGFPSEASFVALAGRILQGSADILEVGIPFSDPLADGPTIQYSSQRALKSGATVGRSIEMIGRVDNPEGRPIVVMSYLNPLMQYGLERFSVEAHDAGAAGVIIPDVICEEGREMERTFANAGIDLIYLLAPTSSPARRKMILERSRGFVYLVSVAGVTGARKQLPAELNGWIASVRSESRLPVAVGFGISGPEQAGQVARVADGVIVGSAIIDILRNGFGPAEALNEAVGFLATLKRSLRIDQESSEENRT